MVSMFVSKSVAFWFNLDSNGEGLVWDCAWQLCRNSAFSGVNTKGVAQSPKNK